MKPILALFALFVLFVATINASAAFFTARDVPADRLRIDMGLNALPFGTEDLRLAGGSSGYAELRRSELPVLHALFLAHLNKLGLPARITAPGARWDVRLNCYGLSRAFVAFANAQLCLERWHSSSCAPMPAMAITCYVTRNGGRHAIVLIVTDDGPLFWDPQSGPVELTPAELASRWYPQG